MKIKMFLMGVFASLLFITGVDAETINVANGDDLAAKVAAANPGDVIEIEDGTYVGNVTVSKDVTIRGESRNGTIINGLVYIVDGADVNLEDLSISRTLPSTSSHIWIDKTSDVVITNCKIAYEGYNGTYDVDNETFGIFVAQTASGSNLEIYDSEIVARYAVSIRGNNNYVYIESSELTGWSALDISQGGVSELSSNNEVYVSNSILTGYASEAGGNLQTSSTVLIGGQNGLILDIYGSTIQNDATINNQFLIGYGMNYPESKDTLVYIADSKLINNDDEGSTVFTYGGTEESGKNVGADDNNRIVTSNVDIQSANPMIYNEIAGMVSVTVKSMSDTYIVYTNKGASLENNSYLEELMQDFEIAYEDYEYKGLFYEDGREFNLEDIIEEDTVVTAKYVEIPDEDQSTDTDTDKETTKEEVDKELLDDVPDTGNMSIFEFIKYILFR